MSYTGLGKVKVENKGTNLTFVLIYNFDLDGDELKPQHHDQLEPILRDVITPRNSVFLRGLTDRTAGAVHNRRLAERRVRNVFTYLKPRLLNRGTLSNLDWLGEMKAAGRDPDEVEDEYFRAVLMAVVVGPVPPPPNVVLELPPIVDQRDPVPPPRLCHVFKIAVTAGAEAPIAGPIGVAAFNFLIWDVVGSSAALYDTGPTPRFGLSFPPGLPGLSALHIGRPLTFTSFAPLRRFRVDRFDGPFALNRASNLGESFAELHMPGRAYIPAFNMGSSIGLPSVVSGSIVRGNMSLKFPRFRYQGETF